tara:strand:- start:318 stop:647 length:330 start_codon:yes stop_codon:yes gene_type:complete
MITSKIKISFLSVIYKTLSFTSLISFSFSCGDLDLLDLESEAQEILEEGSEDRTQIDQNDPNKTKALISKNFINLQALIAANGSLIAGAKFLLRPNCIPADIDMLSLSM